MNNSGGENIFFLRRLLTQRSYHLPRFDVSARRKTKSHATSSLLANVPTKVFRWYLSASSLRVYPFVPRPSLRGALPPPLRLQKSLHGRLSVTIFVKSQSTRCTSRSMSSFTSLLSFKAISAFPGGFCYLRWGMRPGVVHNVSVTQVFTPFHRHYGVHDNRHRTYGAASNALAARLAEGQLVTCQRVR